MLFSPIAGAEVGALGGEGIYMGDIEKNNLNNSQENMELNETFILTYYDKLVDRLEGINDRIWTQSGYFTTIFISLLTIPIVILFSYYSIILGYPFLALILLLLPLSGISVIIIAYESNFKQFKNLYTLVTIMSKIEEKFGLKKKRKGNILPEDEYLLPDEYLTINSKLGYKSTREFVERNIFGDRCKGKIGYYIRKLYGFMLLLGIFETSAFISFFGYSSVKLMGATDLHLLYVTVIVFIISMIVMCILLLWILHSIRGNVKSELK